MANKPADVLKLIKDQEIEWVDLRFTDPKGKWQHLTMVAGVVGEDEGDLIGSWRERWRSADRRARGLLDHAEIELGLAPDISVPFDLDLEHHARSGIVATRATVSHGAHPWWERIHKLRRSCPPVRGGPRRSG